MGNAQSLIFTIYGDYIRHYGNKIWIGSLIRIMKEFGHNEQAVRVAVSRTMKRGLLESERQGNKSYYCLTSRGKARIEEGVKRTNKLEVPDWDGKWYMFMYTIPEDKRQIRDELRKKLLWNGFGSFSNGCWISPYNFTEKMKVIIDKYEIKSNVDLFVAEYKGLGSNRELAEKSWPIQEIEENYESFIAKYSKKLIAHESMIEKGQMTGAACFVERTKLVNDYRSILFTDPGLPLELLPEIWTGNHAALLFEKYYRLLAQPASLFFEDVFREENDLREKDNSYDADIHPFILN